MALTKLICGLLLVAGGATAKYYNIQGWPVPVYLKYGLIILVCVFLILFLVSYANRPPRNL